MEPASEMPAFVSIAPSEFFATGPGFLGPQYAADGRGKRPRCGSRRDQQMSQQEFGPPLRVENLDSPAGVTTTHAEARLGLLNDLDRDFLAHRPGVPVASHLSAYERAVRLMRAKGSEAFDLDEEPRELRLKYGRTQFGQGCLLARRLIERGVPFVEVSLSGGQPLAWDTHVDNFKAVTSLSETLDAGWSALVDDLKDRGMLDTHVDRLDGRVRPHAEDQSQQRPRPFSAGLVDRADGGRHPRRAGDRQDGRRRNVGRRAAGRRRRLSGHDLPRFGDRSHQAERLERRAARSASSTRRRLPSKKPWHERRPANPVPWPFVAACVFASGNVSAGNRTAGEEPERRRSGPALPRRRKRPIVIRLHHACRWATVNGDRAAIAREIFESLDADSNGVLEGKELAGIPSAELLAAAAKGAGKKASRFAQ